MVKISRNTRYTISRNGEVWDMHPRRWKRFGPARRISQYLTCGYPSVGIANPNGVGVKTVFIHRLLCETFIPNPNNYPLVRHLNDVKTDNRLENLSWGTRADNGSDASKNGRYDGNGGELGEDNNFAKLCEDDIVDIRCLRSYGASLRDLASLFGVTKANVHSICLRKTWKHIP